MNELQIQIQRRSDNQSVRAQATLQDLHWTTMVNGGFGTCSFFIPGVPAQVMTDTGLEFLATLRLMDGGAGMLTRFGGDPVSSILFEGEVIDLQPSVSSGRTGVAVEVAGYQSITNEPYRAAPILKDVAQRMVKVPALSGNRDQAGTVNTGAGPALGGIATAGDEQGGFVFANASAALGSVAAGAFAGIQAEMPLRMTRLKFTLSTFQGASYRFRVVYAASFLASNNVPLDVNPVGNLAPTAHDLSIPSGFGNVVRWDMINQGGLSYATNAWMFVNQPRVLSPRGPSALDNEPVYGHELVQDVIFNSLLTQDYSQVDTDTSYQFTSADFSAPGTTLRNALDYITAFYDRYWAIYENKVLVWKPSTLTGAPTWVARDGQGLQYELQPSVDQTARSVRVSYRDVAGINREVTYTDPRLDNVYAVAGATKQAQVNLPVVSNSSAAQQIATTYFPDHSYEVMRGTVTLPATVLLQSSKGGAALLPAYKIRAGDSIRLPEIASPRDFFSTQFDRKTLLFIRSTDVDWENDTITLEVDNTRDRMSTLLARIAANVQNRFPGT